MAGKEGANERGRTTRTPTGATDTILLPRPPTPSSIWNSGLKRIRILYGKDAPFTTRIRVNICYLCWNLRPRHGCLLRRGDGWTDELGTNQRRSEGPMKEISPFVFFFVGAAFSVKHCIPEKANERDI